MPGCSSGTSRTRTPGNSWALAVALRVTPHLDLAVLVDGSVDVAPDAVDFDVRVVDVPTVARRVAGDSGGVGEQRGEPVHPPVDGDVVDPDAAFGEEFLDVAVREAVARVPADRHDDHLGGEAEAGERRAGRRPGTRPSRGLHRSTVPDHLIS